jgi:hypothetical protein
MSTYKLRQASDDEHLFMENLFKLFVTDINSKRKTYQLYLGDRKHQALIFKGSLAYSETQSSYYVNAFMDRLEAGEVIDYNRPTAIKISKNTLKEFMKTNNIIKPKFNKAKLIK